MKKKNSIYFIAPLVGLVAFGALYWNFHSGYEARLQAGLDKQKEEKRLKLEKEEQDRKKAYDDAIATQARRKKEKEEKEKRDQEERDTRQMAYQERDKAQRESLKLEERVRALSKDIDVVKTEIKEIEGKKKEQVDEEAFLRNHVKQAQATHANYQAILQKIADADKAAAEQAAIEAARAKEKK